MPPTERARAAGDAADDPVRRRVMRLLHVPPLALLLGLGLAPLFILFPRLPGGPEHDPTVQPVALWLGTALLGGLAGALDGAARPLYRAGGILLAAALLSIPAMRLALLSGLPFPHGLATWLATWLGLDGEFAMEAALYEIWLVGWLACLGLIVLARHGLVRVVRARRAEAAGGATTAPTGPRSRPRARAR